ILAVCVDPGKPVNGSRIGDTFLDGQAVAFSCRPSHTLIGAPILRCIAGKWNKPTPKCKASCKDPGTPKNGVRHGTEFTHNKRISFACLAGFQLTGTANVVCINGKWSASTPQCKAVCVDPGKPVNGSRIGDTFLDGQAVAFSCRPSHTLIGAPILRCVAGKWNKPTPKCKASCPDLVAPINGRAIDFKPGYRHGEQAKFSCDSGFKLIGSSNIRCLDGKWSSTTPFCKATCKDPGVPLNGKRKGSTFIDGDTVEFLCDENFSLVGSSISRCLGGRWSSAFPECKASCPDPGIPVNGERVNGSFAHGKHLQFRCKPGFWLVGSQLIVCREGTWSNEIPTCRASCPDPGIPRHGRRIGSNFGHGGQVTFGCLKDFTRLGSQSMTCHDGKWSSVVPVCKASCKDPGTPKNGVRHGNEFTHNKRISFTCSAAFQLTGTPNVVCINGKWSASTPQCKAVCVDPGKPVNGSRIGDTFLDGQAVAFSCGPSHTLIGAPILRCVAGKWNKPTPKCKASCPDPVAPVNGRAIDFKPGYRHGEQAKFSCDSGFKLIGSSNIRCLDGKWSSTAPLCTDIDECSEGVSRCHANAECTNTIGSFTCKCNVGSVGNGKSCFKNCNDPGTPKNGQRKGSDFDHGSELTFSCQPDFTLVGGRNITCRDGTWGGRVPVCMANCKNPGVPLHGSRTGDNFQNGQTVSFSCNRGYKLIGRKAIRCQRGVWSSSLPQCKKSCNDPGRPNNGQRRGGDFQHEKTVTFTCQPNFKLVGRGAITCRDGTWSGRVPVCMASCKNPGVPRHGVRPSVNFQHGKIVNFWCKSGYTLIGSRSIRCQNGVWSSSSLPQCKKTCNNPGTPKNGQRKGNDFRHGRNVTFTCQTDFKLLGNETLTCSDGTWSSRVPVCSASCQNPGAPRHGSRTGDNFQHGKTVSFSCNHGHMLIGRKVIRCQKGVWSSSVPQCKKSCIDPGKPRNGRKIGADYRHGRSVSFVCQRTFKLTGVNRITCRDGAWSGNVPTCRALCPALTNIRHGSYNGSNYAGDSVTYTCDDRYLLDGSSVVTCVDGRWNGTRPICRAPCSPPIPPVNGFVFGDNHQHQSVVQFWCDQGYILQGSASSECFDGKWDKRAPLCKDTTKSCRKPTLPPNAYLRLVQSQMEVFPDGARVYYRCNLGYSQVGFPIQRCANGQWTKLAFRCQPRSCGNPGRIKNGKISSYVFTYNRTVEYSCSPGYTLMGSKTRLCQANGTWSGTSARCTTVDCRPLTAPSNGEIVEASTSFKGKVKFRCVGMQYKLVGPSIRTCLPNGQWSGTQPSCDLIVCSDPGTPENGKRKITRGLYHTGSVRFSCTRKHKLVGAHIIYCMRDGTWSRPKPNCLAPCSNPGTPKNGRRNASDFRHNRVVRFRCNRNFRLVGLKAITCKNGQWSGAAPTCQERNLH
ncbi:sushi, von Willebrand factor type A, EGF and pentraxin domain-containing protein 1-like, partial [Stylophora pistillata]|uniref:sushi, von Willebrand factor type A, EGF and pentraxin domain-containing protein 1-like n=1 Tax=Stylophora pistillata TaxID=50429 RepID=UPI000C04A54E